jgi:hypothetical protein
MSKHTYKIQTKYGNQIHIKNSGSDFTMCGKPQENYDTEEGLVTVEGFIKFGRNGTDCCKKCLLVAQQREKLESLNNKEGL